MWITIRKSDKTIFHLDLFSITGVEEMNSGKLILYAKGINTSIHVPEKDAAQHILSLLQQHREGFLK